MAADTEYLKLLLSNLPASLPTASSAEYPFDDFQPDQELLQDEGLSPAGSKIFKMLFGWQSEDNLQRTGPLVVKARGDAVIAAADVLSRYLEHEECARNLGPITQWVEKLTRMALDTFKAHRTRVRERCRLVWKQAEYHTVTGNRPSKLVRVPTFQEPVQVEHGLQNARHVCTR